MQAQYRALAVLTLIGLLAAPRDQLSAAQPAAGSTSRQARDEAMRALPMAKIPSSKRARVAAIVNDSTLFRHMPTQVIECDPSFYTFLVENPEVIVSVWRTLGISEVKLNRMADDTLQADDSAGTVGKIEMLYHDHETHVYYAEGTYDGPVLASPLSGKCVLLLRSAFVRETNGRYYITCRCDTFVRLDNATLEVFAKVIQPLVGQVADHNFRETALFIGGLNEAAEKNLTGVQDLATRLREVTPEKRKEFAILSEKAAINAAMAQSESTRSAVRPTRRPR